MGLLRIWHTVRALRQSQIWGRIWFRINRPRPDGRPAPFLRAAGQRWTLCARSASMTGPLRFRLLNVEHQLTSIADWNRTDWPKLWLYNLHYFDDLAARDAGQRADWHRALLGRWVDENPPGRGNGWEPYPVSLRTVNWIKWVLSGNRLDGRLVHSLATQVRWLGKRLEFHLLGNHLWANAKALVFAGAFFEGAEAENWRARGLELVQREIEEQVLPDGGHFERSPMYHAVVLEDMLDLVQLTSVFPGMFPESSVFRWRGTAARMLRWLAAMTHPDGEIVFFNDAALGIAPSLAKLGNYAHSLGIEGRATGFAAVEPLPDSGYVRLQVGPAVLIVDVGEIGPPYLAGHAHADTLSFELSWRGHRLMTNSGTSTYETGPHRHRERSTAAHNTVVVDGQNSSDVWAGFRVGRRARPGPVEVQGGQGACRVIASHDGYRHLRGRPVHRRELRLTNNGIRVEDRIDGRFTHVATGYFHLAPSVSVRRMSDDVLRVVHPAGFELEIRGEDGVALEICEGCYSREFGISETRSVVAWRLEGPLPLTAAISIQERR